MDSETADKFIAGFGNNDAKYLIGFHIGAGKKNNMWSLEKYTALIKKLNQHFQSKFYITGSNVDKEEINYLQQNVDVKFGVFLNRSIPQVASLISKSNLFISNDTGIMHVAGTTETPQISIFGPTNPFNWAPIGSNKYFIHKSELIDDVAVDDVFHLCDLILNNKEVHK
jgi:heptosyltransferase-2